MQESWRLRRPLSVADSHRLATDLDFRIHDFLATVCQLVVRGAITWARIRGEISAGELERLYVYGRLDEDSAEKSAVTWEPLD